MKTVCTICARGGSTGVPRKNIRILHGKPLIAHSIEQAKASRLIDLIYVSTDDDEIAAVARDYGAIVPFRRPAELATTEVAKLPVIEHLVAHIARSGVEFGRVVDLDPTSPLRAIADIDAAIAMLDDATDVVFTGYLADKNPYFNLAEVKADGTYGLVCASADPIVARQAAPKVYALNGSVYVWHHDTVSKGLWGGRSKMLEMPRERSIDIDSEIDFRLVEMLMQEARN